MANSVCKDLKRSSLSTKSRLLAGERTGKDMDGGEDTSRSFRIGEDNGDDLVAWLGFTCAAAALGLWGILDILAAGLDILGESGGDSSCIQEMGLSSMFVIKSILMGVGGGKGKVGFIMENKLLSVILKTC